MDGFDVRARSVLDLELGDRVAGLAAVRTVVGFHPADDETGHVIVRYEISPVEGMPSIAAPAARYHPTAHVRVLELAARQGVPA